jgi:hypothetical protein
MAGLEAYQASDYATAARELRAALALRESAELRLYTGSAELLGGHARRPSHCSRLRRLNPSIQSSGRRHCGSS